MSGFNPLRARIEALTGAHECWDGDNFIDRHPELLDKDAVLAALNVPAQEPPATAVLRPVGGACETCHHSPPGWCGHSCCAPDRNPDAKALIDGWHLTNGAIDAMNAALSKSFAIYDDPEAGTDVDGDSVTVMDRLMDNGYVVASWTALRAALEAAPVAPEPLIEVDRVAVGVGPVEAYRASLAQPDTDQPKPLACSTCGHSPYGWCGHECCRADQPESAPVEDR
jgi:hypothetical protein